MAKSLPTPPPQRARILIVDDYPIVRVGLAALIAQQPDLSVCGDTHDPAEALRLVSSAKPDLAIIDGDLKTGSGIELIKRLKARREATLLLAWSTYTEAHFAERALRAGALGYLTKDQSTDRIVLAIRQVLKGKVFISEPLADQLLHRVVGSRGNALELSSVELLSDRELEVFQLLGQGLDRHAIAARLRVSAKTVETYRTRIKEKLQLGTATELLRQAVAWWLENR